MTPFQRMLSSLTIDALEGSDRQEAIAAGISTTKADDWRRLHDIYFGPIEANQQRAKALKRAREGRFTLDQLAAIERALKKVPHAAARMRLRLKLLATRVNYRSLLALVKQLVPKKETPPQKGLTFSKSRFRLRKMILTADERDIADIEACVSQGLDPNSPAALQMMKILLAILRKGQAVPRAIPRPIVVVPVPDYMKILGGEGDDVMLGLTDGTTMTGAEFLDANFSGPLEVAAFHPQEGPVNLYRAQRFANQKQRDLARTATPVCPVPDCRHGADSCEIHHIVAWKNDGETNLSNLVPLCRYHNGTNDDDPSHPRRGRIERIAGVPTWVSPRGYAVANPYHSFAPGRALFTPAGG